MCWASVPDPWSTFILHLKVNGSRLPVTPLLVRWRLLSPMKGHQWEDILGRLPDMVFPIQFQGQHPVLQCRLALGFLRMASYLSFFVFPSTSKQKGWLRCHLIASLGADQGRRPGCKQGKQNPKKWGGWRHACWRCSRRDRQRSKQPSELERPARLGLKPLAQACFFFTEESDTASLSNLLFFIFIFYGNGTKTPIM